MQSALKRFRPRAQPAELRALIAPNAYLTDERRLFRVISRRTSVDETLI